MPNKYRQLDLLAKDLDLIKLVFDYSGGLLVPADTNVMLNVTEMLQV